MGNLHEMVKAAQGTALLIDTGQRFGVLQVRDSQGDELWGVAYAGGRAVTPNIKLLGTSIN
jgi:hypothetical protein